MYCAIVAEVLLHRLANGPNKQTEEIQMLRPFIE